MDWEEEERVRDKDIVAASDCSCWQYNVVYMNCPFTVITESYA